MPFIYSVHGKYIEAVPNWVDELLNILVECGMENVCDYLEEDPAEYEYCAKNCQNIRKECWIRYGLMMAKKHEAEFKAKFEMLHQ